MKAKVGQLALLILAFSALVAVMTWPQMRELRSVHDLADPLFSIWRLEWINHQIVRDPRHLFDGNIFYPERFVLTYSDPALLAGLMAAPLVWIGVHPVATYNLVLLSAFVLSGVTMFILVRSLTADPAAAWIAGAIFAIYPYRMEHYGHLELQMTMCMPAALWALHRTLARGRMGDGLLTGLAFALQVLSCLYYGAFFAIYAAVVGAVLWLFGRRSWRPLAPLAAGAALAALLVAPLATAYLASRPTMGTRDDATVREFSATPRDYLKPTYSSLVYGRWSWAEGGQAERQLFPRVAPVVLAAVALAPPLSLARVAYAAALALSVDASFGLHSVTFTTLRATLSPFKDIRSPARFSILAGMTLAILAGYGAARLLARWPRHRLVITAALTSVVLVEGISEVRLEPVWPEPPAIYSSIAGQEPPVVLAEFPMQKGPTGDSFDPAFEYFSTFHWQRMVNGYSGFFPRSYVELLDVMLDFPSESTLAYLRGRGVSYVAIHGRFMHPVRYAETTAWLDARRDVQLVAKTPWRGAEARLYRISGERAARASPRERSGDQGDPASERAGGPRGEAPGQ